jgi:hypothetical protein
MVFVRPRIRTFWDEKYNPLISSALPEVNLVGLHAAGTDISQSAVPRRELPPHGIIDG